jgi:hypothetical protein
MILTLKQSEQLRNGTLTKPNFNKLVDTLDFEDYLYRYCNIKNDTRNEILNTRETTFKAFNYTVVVLMQNGKCVKYSYSKD